MKIVINLKSKKAVSTRTNFATKKPSWLSLLHGTLFESDNEQITICSVTTERLA